MEEPFRNPSAFELYFRDGYSFRDNPHLYPETAHTWEFSVERKLNKALTATVNAYYYRLNSLITAEPQDDGTQVFKNNASSRSTGVDWELNGKLFSWLETTASIAVQRAIDVGTGVPLANSPRHVGKLRFAIPVLRGRLYLSGSSQYLGARTTWTGQVASPVFRADTTITTNRLHRNFDVQFGIRNLLDRRYDDPTALKVDLIRQDGRSAFVKLIWHAWE